LYLNVPESSQPAVDKPFQCKLRLQHSYVFRSVCGISLLLVAGFVYAKLASCGAVAPASIHEVFQMRRAVAVGNSSFLLIFWSA
jgi:hypothetical protein